MTPSPAKRWSVTVASDEDGSLRLWVADRTAAEGQPGHEWTAGKLLDLTPVEYLLIAVGSCYALSCRAALASRRLPRVKFRVTTVGIKAIDAPSRLDQIEVLAEFDDGLIQEDADAVAADAKSLCTVSNTILLPLETTIRASVRSPVVTRSS